MIASRGRDNNHVPEFPTFQRTEEARVLQSMNMMSEGARISRAPEVRRVSRGIGVGCAKGGQLVCFIYHDDR